MRGMRIGLQDTEGIFLDLVPEEPEKTPSGEQHGEATGSRGGTYPQSGE